MANAVSSEFFVFAADVTPRLTYILDTLSGGKAKLITDLHAANGQTILVNYSPQPISDSLQIIPHGLLAEKDIQEQDTRCFDWKGLKAFFRTGGDIPFDIFSAAFYLLSRYEEYLPFTPDVYGRYPHTASLAYKENFLDQPLVNNWLQELDAEIINRFPATTARFQYSRFRYIPTYDIDMAYAYRYQPVWKNVGGFFRDLLRGKIDKVLERGNVYSGNAKDPFDSFDWLDELHARFRLKPAFFLLTIIRRGLHDKNLNANSKGLQRLYNRLASVYVTGLHPSWRSGDEETLLLEEKKKLEGIVKHKVFISRNHYLRFTLPHSYRRLIDAEMTDDHSMAYGTINGFRASYALPFRWYDLEQERITHLVVHPFCYMEANSFFQQHYSPAEALKEMQRYHDAVKKVNGELITLFHNHFLTTQPEWAEWRKMYETFLTNNFN